jgi:hypothetical protein
MKRPGFRVATALVLAGAGLLTSAPARAADTFAATITADAQKVVFTHGMAWIDGKGKLWVGLYKTEPNAAEQARALKGGGNIFGVFDVPNVTMDLSFKDGTTRADLASFESCHINFSRFDAGIGIFDLNAFTKSCGPVAFSGDLKAGSVIHGKLKGTGQGFPDKNGKQPVYTWDVDFTATPRAKP